MHQQVSGFLSGLINYINSDPQKVWSGAMRSYRTLNTEYIKVCRDEYHDSVIGVYNRESIYRKNLLKKRIQKIRKVLTTSPYRNYSRNLDSYIKAKNIRFSNKLNKF